MEAIGMTLKVKHKMYESIKHRVDRLEKAVDAHLHRMLYSGKVVGLIQKGGKHKRTLYEVQLDEGTIVLCQIGEELPEATTHIEVKDRVEIEYQAGSMNKGHIVAV